MCSWIGTTTKLKRIHAQNIIPIQHYTDNEIIAILAFTQQVATKMALLAHQLQEDAPKSTSSPSAIGGVYTDDSPYS